MGEIQLFKPIHKECEFEWLIFVWRNDGAESIYCRSLGSFYIGRGWSSELGQFFSGLGLSPNLGLFFRILLGIFFSKETEVIFIRTVYRMICAFGRRGTPGLGLQILASVRVLKRD